MPTIKNSKRDLGYVRPQTLDDFVLQLPEAFQEPMLRLGSAVQSAAPEAEIVINYGKPFFMYRYMLVAIGATKDFCSLHVMSATALKDLKNELKGQRISGTTIHFRPNEPIPETIVKKVVKARVRENEERFKQKK